MDAILLTVPDGHIIAVNSAACAMFGRTEDEIIQIGRNGLVDINDPRLPILLEERKKNGKAKGELNFKRKDGSIFPCEISSALYTDASWHPEMFSSLVIGILRTIKNIPFRLGRRH
jgi:PAS domain S-box-containing protein